MIDKNTREPMFIMLVGLPGSGKSTWRNQFITKLADLEKEPIVLSTDDYIEFMSSVSGRTYNEAFKDMIEPAKAFMSANLLDALENDFDIVWDQTNLTIKSRQNKLKKIPTHYRKTCLSFLNVDTEVIKQRNEERKKKGRAIPERVLMNMIMNYEQPSITEGFDEVFYF